MAACNVYAFVAYVYIKRLENFYIEKYIYMYAHTRINIIMINQLRLFNIAQSVHS